MHFLHRKQHQCPFCVSLRKVKITEKRHTKTLHFAPVQPILTVFVAARDLAKVADIFNHAKLCIDQYCFGLTKMVKFRVLLQEAVIVLTSMCSLIVLTRDHLVTYFDQPAD